MAMRNPGNDVRYIQEDMVAEYHSRHSAGRTAAASNDAPANSDVRGSAVGGMPTAAHRAKLEAKSGHGTGAQISGCLGRKCRLVYTDGPEKHAVDVIRVASAGPTSGVYVWMADGNPGADGRIWKTTAQRRTSGG